MRIVAALIFFALATMTAQQAVAQQPCPVLVVDSTGDGVNGDTSSPCALIANPGSDGITLRAAIMAANNATGAGTITITFAPSLGGQTITLNSSAGLALDISRSDVTIAGFLQSGKPAVTINANNMFVVFNVLASAFTLSNLNITGVASGDFGVQIWTGAGWTPSAPQAVSDIRIEGNVFDNQAGSNDGIPLTLGTNATSASGAVLSDVTIADNTFSGYTTDAVRVTEWGNGNTIKNVSIVNNAFTGTLTPIELVPANGAANNSIVGTSIIGNTFTGNTQPIVIDPSGSEGQSSPTTGNTVADTVIENNVFAGNTGPTIVLLGGITAPAGSTVEVTLNTISNTEIVNNQITGNTSQSPIVLVGGGTEASQNSVNGVRIVNNTIANYAGTPGQGGSAISVENDQPGGTDNTVTGVSILNTILWNNTPSDLNGIAASQVTTSITAQAGYADVNGNIAANPLFVNASDNFELQSGSPAIGAGTSVGAPAIDIDCQARGAPPSIGAYEYQGPYICPATYSPPLPLTATPGAGGNPLAVAFRTSGLIRGKSYEINFGDGSIGPVMQDRWCLVAPPVAGGEGGVECSGSASHTYSKAGTYTATLVNVSGGRLGSSVMITVGGLTPLAAGGG